MKPFPTGMRHAEVPQTRSAGGDGHREIECEEALAALGFASDDADGLLRPQSCDEPALLIGTGGELPGRFHRQYIHRLRPATALT